ncbi:YidC/Oxa1 family insertase periplasmic-domain containing protein, partial [Candidatus Sumerlaeota bacterium]|nr:YidC/Oxa1 family insertase periplasmic-domain containing protein [Candidatus Sumerlaeota bacterium]
VPTVWNIIDPRYAIAHGGKPLADETKDGAVPLIDDGLAERGLSLPFEVILKEQNARYYKEFNQQTYKVSRPDAGPDIEAIAFESPQTESGLQLVKTYRFAKKDYAAELSLRFVNHGTSKLSFNNSGQGVGLTIGPGLGLPPEGGGKGNRYTFTRPFLKTGSGIETPSPKKTGEFSDPKAGVEWAGMHNRYFMICAAPLLSGPESKGFSAVRSRIDLDVVSTGLASDATANFYPQLELHLPPFTLSPGETAEYTYGIFAGPKERKTLMEARLGLDPKTPPAGLDKIQFYNSWSWMRALSVLLLTTLRWFQGLLGSWGLAIISLVVSIRLLTFPLAQIGMKHHAKMMADQARLKPHLDRINEKYKNDPQKKSQETMKLYHEHGVNPFGAFKGCIWLFIQLPIFISLYRILGESIDLRGASFLWIDDLSQSDRLFNLGFILPFTTESHFNLLPLLTAATQMGLGWMSAKSNPAMADNPMQKQMTFMMPVVILVITYGFPSGLVLYWLISNLWQIIQQRFVNKRYLPSPAKV